MASPTMAYGERRFGAAYTIRVFAALAVFGALIGLWIDDPNTAAHPQLTWVSIVAMCIILGGVALVQTGGRRSNRTVEIQVAREETAA